MCVKVFVCERKTQSERDKGETEHAHSIVLFSFKTPNTFNVHCRRQFVLLVFDSAQVSTLVFKYIMFTLVLQHSSFCYITVHWCDCLFKSTASLLQCSASWIPSIFPPYRIFSVAASRPLASLNHLSLQTTSVSSIKQLCIYT